MRAHIKCHLSTSNVQHSLGIGDLIGRSEQAALCIDDPCISEAHALLSLRGGALMLLALRGRFRYRGQVVAELELRAGMDIELYKDFWLHCDEVVLPLVLTGLSIPGLPLTTLTHTSSLFFDPLTQKFSLHQGHLAQADVILWSLGGAWSYRKRDGIAHDLKPGGTFEIGGQGISCVQIEVEQAGIAKTKRTARQPICLEVSHGHVKVRADVHGRTGVISGIPGKMLSCLARHDHPTSWDHIAAQVWPGDLSTKASMRQRFDVGLRRLRDKLQQFDLPSDLIRLDGAGSIRLHVEPEDTLSFVDEAERVEQ